MNGTVIITGASGNLGGAIAQKLKSEGYSILGTVGSSRSLSRLQEAGINAEPVDLTDEAAVQTYVDKIDAPISAAVLTVGGFAMGGFAETTGEDLQKMYKLNFETSYFLVRALLPRLEANGGGRIILVGTRPAINPTEGKNLIAYSLSKKLVSYLVELINAYGADKKISSAIVVPSIIDTPINRKNMPNADFSTWVSLEAIADSISFLLSESGSQVKDAVLKLYNES